VIVLAAAASKPDTWTLRPDHAPLS
jgi:hypothetical protein